MQLTRAGGPQHIIRAWESGRLRIAERWLTGNLIVSADAIVEGWTTATPTALTLDDLAPALAFAPTILLLGTGTDKFLPDVDLMAALAEQRVGLEIMSTPAACRTFNVLLQEQRRVVAALFNP
ncbi:MAG: MTH938/NDUFAF3 family protein [Gammaproteobacteria bacterium]